MSSSAEGKEWNAGKLMTGRSYGGCRIIGAKMQVEGTATVQQEDDEGNAMVMDPLQERNPSYDAKSAARAKP